jgi:DNA-binding transcriptional ArsR family regulator
MNESAVLVALADALASASATLRQHAARLGGAVVDAPATSNAPTDVVARARIMHAYLGVRQAQILELLAEAYPDSTDTGKLSRQMDYDQPNVYLTLKGLIEQGLVEKDAAAHPHQYKLSAVLLGGK